ncbi:group III truncated hemoglobin [Massilia putida]|uniref:group III truncated hemoglobin n=1 Tax=Massilia putida TaxID=1141883 RepID=UPI000952C59D|nr:group III truncated hemoglobin [Massilia putida]
MSSPAITESSIIQLVDTFYARVRDDAVLSPVFEAKLAGRWHEHMPRMYAFWTKVLLGTGEFNGNVFGKHMALSGIETEHFIRWLTLFRLTAVDVFGVDGAGEALAVAQRIASSLQLGFFGDIRV